MIRNIERSRTWRLAATTLVTTTIACSSPAPDANDATTGTAADESMAAPADAHYMTHLVFASPDGKAFFGAFDQTATSLRLTRGYDAWWTGEETWEPLVRARDTLPVPRAAWRLLPTSDMSIRVGDAGQIVSLTFPPEPDSERDTLRLRAGEEVAVWTGPTGQRESLGLAMLESGDEGRPGILFFRRAARALSIPATGEGTRTFVLADSLGNGLLIHEGSFRQPASARTWLHGIESAWGDVVLVPADSLEASEGWRFEIPGTDLMGDIRQIPESDASAMVRLEATVTTGGEAFRFAGLSATLALP